MNTEMILKSDALDILFDNRNKLYGAYPLRKFYPERIKTALVITFSSALVFCVFALMPKANSNIIDVTSYEDPTLGNIRPVKKEPEIKPKTETAIKEKINAQKWVSILKMVKDSSDKLTDNLDSIRIESVNIKGGTNDGSVEISENISPAAGAFAAEIPITDPAVPVENPEIEPSFPGGMNALRNFLQKNLTNPKDLQEGEQVSVQVKFIVGYDGKLQRFETIKDGGTEFNEEVIRVLKKMPQWIAGKSNGKNVSVYYTIPVKFVSND
jgi:protein TonB